MKTLLAVLFVGALGLTGPASSTAHARPELANPFAGTYSGTLISGEAPGTFDVVATFKISIDGRIKSRHASVPFLPGYKVRAEGTIDAGGTAVVLVRVKIDHEWRDFTTISTQYGGLDDQGIWLVDANESSIVSLLARR